MVGKRRKRENPVEDRCFFSVSRGGIDKKQEKSCIREKTKQKDQQMKKRRKVDIKQGWNFGRGPVVRCNEHLLGSLSARVFETWTATGSELFSLLTCLYTITFTLLSIFSPFEMISVKIWETPLP